MLRTHFSKKKKKKKVIALNLHPIFFMKIVLSHLSTNHIITHVTYIYGWTAPSWLESHPSFGQLEWLNRPFWTGWPHHDPDMLWGGWLNHLLQGPSHLLRNLLWVTRIIVCMYDWCWYGICWFYTNFGWKLGIETFVFF